MRASPREALTVMLTAVPGRCQLCPSRTVNCGPRSPRAPFRLHSSISARAGTRMRSQGGGTQTQKLCSTLKAPHLSSSIPVWTPLLLPTSLRVSTYLRVLPSQVCSRPPLPTALCKLLIQSPPSSACARHLAQAIISPGSPCLCHPSHTPAPQTGQSQPRCQTRPAQPSQDEDPHSLPCLT